MLRIAIKRENGVVVFDPVNATTSIGEDGGTFIFENYDTKPHQPEPDDASFGVWFPTAIAAGHANKATPSILNTVNTVANISYHCNLNNALKGSINFTA